MLRSNRPFTALLCARSVSFLGDSLSLVALMLHVAGTTGEALAVALLLLVGDFAPSLLAPLAGTVSDRFDLRRVMIVCDLVQGALVAVIAFVLPALPLLMVLVGLRSVAGQVFQPASRAAVPALVPDKDLEAANSRLGFGTNGAEAVGPLMAAALLPLLGIRGVLLVDAATFLISALVLVRLPRLAPVVDRERTSFLADAKAGLGYIVSVPVVRAIGVGFCVVVAFNGVDDVALVFLATDSLGGGQSAAGLLLAGVGVGLFVGYLLLARGAGRLPMVPLFLAGLAVSSAGNLLSGVAWAVAAAFVMQTVRGIGIAAMDVGANTLLQRTVPADMLGRVFGNLYGAIGAAAALSYVAGGVLLDLTSPRITLVIAGTGGLIATIVTAIALRRRGVGSTR
nr:transporter, putative [Kibdelosporangium sp. MJ126-NF4]CTQ92133.1 transporter, putative [Kibdelosporangium sp. MJ126-NF4]